MELDVGTRLGFWEFVVRVVGEEELSVDMFVLGLNSQLQRMKKEGISIFEYIARIKDVFDKYSAMGEQLSYGDKLMYCNTPNYAIVVYYMFRV